MNLLLYATFYGYLITPGLLLQIQCYHCEEFLLNDDCSLPQFIVNCTANIQNGCQKETVVQQDGILYRKSCASLSSCLITSAGYQPFCSPGKVGSVCITCCDKSLCNGPRHPRSTSSFSKSPCVGLLVTCIVFFKNALLLS
ncbi:ly6/PLAUR domain-containing protein 1-like [Protopterus annectens]|uniref:ly6/PLAUR domain-containing protein 1-like n=1 Tax=Protopterus annectens TaxID=7888 RepID=UPI001CF9E543|nr:ly6/PLAUR domain-containing protein 1-like [Protopterus annectens]